MRNVWGVMFVLAALLVGSAYSQETTIERVGDWTIERARDLFTDAEQAVAYVRPSQHPPLGARDMFTIGCVESAANLKVDGVVIMLAGSVYVSDSYVEVERRVDSLPPYSDAWFVNRTSLALNQQSAVRKFLAELLDAEQLALRYRGYSETATYVFPVEGAREVLATLGCYTGEL